MSVRNHSQSVQNESGQLNLFVRDNGTSNIYPHIRTLRFEPEGCLVYGPGSREATINTASDSAAVSNAVTANILWEVGTTSVPSSIKAKYAAPPCDATGINAVSHGGDCVASGLDSHAEGKDTRAQGIGSHAEGHRSNAWGAYSHCEGFGSSLITAQRLLAYGDHSHAEGYETEAWGDASHSEGWDTFAMGIRSHSEGWNTIANGQASHSEGQTSNASGNFSHVEGNRTFANGEYAHAEGSFSNAWGYASHSEGENTRSIGIASHACGKDSRSIGDYSHASGIGSFAYGGGSFVHGNVCSVDATCIDSGILGGKTNEIQDADYSVIVGGQGNTIVTGHDNTTILGGTGINSFASNTVYASDHLQVGNHTTDTSGSILRISAALSTPLIPAGWEDGNCGNPDELWFTAGDFKAISTNTAAPITTTIRPTALGQNLLAPIAANTPIVSVVTNTDVWQFSAQKLLPRGFSVKNLGEAKFYFRSSPSWTIAGNIEVTLAHLETGALSILGTNGGQGVNPNLLGLPAGNVVGDGKTSIVVILNTTTGPVSGEELMSVMVPISRG